MRPTLPGKLVAAAVLLALTSAASPASAVVGEEPVKQGGPAETLFFRQSQLTYTNLFSAYSLSRSAQPNYDPYWLQAFSFRPRFWVRDDLSFRLRLDLEVELTTSNQSDHAREWVLGDLSLDTIYSPAWMKIPVVGVKVTPVVRFSFPTSIESRGRSMIMAMTYGFGLRRELALRKGKKWLPGLDVGYGFSFNKGLYRHATATVGELEGCQDVFRPECQHRGDQNVSWRFHNSLDATLKIHEKLSFGVSLTFINNLLYAIPGQTVPVGPEVPGMVATLPPSRVNHTTATWAVFDLSYDVLDWLTLSLGTSTLYGQLADDSSFRTPLFNRYTNFYLDVNIPVDAFYDQVRKWAGRPSRRRGAITSGAPRLLANGY